MSGRAVKAILNHCRETPVTSVVYLQRGLDITNAEPDSLELKPWYDVRFIPGTRESIGEIGAGLDDQLWVEYGTFIVSVSAPSFESDLYNVDELADRVFDTVFRFGLTQGADQVVFFDRVNLDQDAQSDEHFGNWVTRQFAVTYELETVR